MNSDYIIYSNSRAIPSKDGPGMSACAAHRLLQSLPDLGGNGANIIPVTAAAAGGYDTSRSPFCRHGCSMMLAFARQPMDSLLGGPYPSEMGRALASAAGPEV